MSKEFNIWMGDVSIFVFNKGYVLAADEKLMDTLIFLFEDDVEAFEAAEIITP